ncbi:MAG: YgfZ/GcvT domain-containing protein [Micrococcales bacterium]
MTAQFGNQLTEQRELLAGRAAAVLDARTVLQVRGDDRQTWLHALLSQNIQGLQPGQSAEALLLDPNGHVEQDIHVFIGDGIVWLTVAAERGSALLSWLNRMIFRAKVEIADVSDRFATVVTFNEPLSGAVFSWRDPWPETVAGGFRYAENIVKPTDWSYLENLVPVGELAALTADFKPAGTLAVDALRIEAHRPSEAELDEKTLPHELDLLATAVHLTKGCYRGQETVAKVHNLGHPPRRLTFLHLDGSGHELPPTGALVRVAGEDQVRGRVTSVGQHFEAGPIALAVLSRSTPVDAQLEVVDEDGRVIAATQEVIVPPDAGKAANLGARRSLLGGRR